MTSIPCLFFFFLLLLAYFVFAVLAVTPALTRTVRIALWPIVAILAWRAIISIDTVSPILHTPLVCSLFHILIRTLDWTVTSERFVRYNRPAHSSPSILVDALDLATNMRGHGWNWSHGVYVPKDTRPTHRVAFALCTLRSAICHLFLNGVLHRAILSFSDVSSTLFDPTLPTPTRHLRASIITILTALASYTTIQAFYTLSTFFAVLVLRHDPDQWPPAFDAPWRSTSLHEFWGRRWQQWNRRGLLVIGGHPLFIVIGPIGRILGAFLASAVLHDVMLLSLDSSAHPRWMLLGFGMMAPGLLAERAFSRYTHKRVGGVVGWVWTMACLVGLGTLMVEGFVRAGGLGHSSLVDGVLQVRA